MRGPRLVHLPSTCSTPCPRPKALDRFHDVPDEAAHLLAVVVRWAMQAGLLERGLRCRPVLRDAGEHTLAVLHDQVDVELDTVEVLLQQEIVAGPEDDVELRIHHLAHDRVDARKILGGVDPNATHRARAELGLDHSRKADVGGGGEELVQ